MDRGLFVRPVVEFGKAHRRVVFAELSVEACRPAIAAAEETEIQCAGGAGDQFRIARQDASALARREGLGGVEADHDRNRVVDKTLGRIGQGVEARRAVDHHGDAGTLVETSPCIDRHRPAQGRHRHHQPDVIQVHLLQQALWIEHPRRCIDVGEPGRISAMLDRRCGGDEGERRNDGQTALGGRATSARQYGPDQRGVSGSRTDSAVGLQRKMHTESPLRTLPPMAHKVGIHA